MNVRKAKKTVTCVMERYDMDDGSVFFVNRFGWIFDHNMIPVPHPEVDDVMQAIQRAENGG